MTNQPDEAPSAATATTRKARGAAQEVIGKLIGDDAEVTKGRAEQHAAARGAGPVKRGDGT